MHRCGFVFLFLLLLTPGCRLVPPLPPADLGEPGWKVQQGQAVWDLPRAENEIAGDLLVATRGDESYVQFTKPPIPLVVARATSNSWEISFPPRNQWFSGRGEPPARLIWLHLPRVLSGRPAPAKWIWHRNSENWRLDNPALGESIEGFLLNEQGAP